MTIFCNRSRLRGIDFKRCRMLYVKLLTQLMSHYRLCICQYSCRNFQRRWVDFFLTIERHPRKPCLLAAVSWTIKWQWRNDSVSRYDILNILLWRLKYKDVESTSIGLQDSRPPIHFSQKQQKWVDRRGKLSISEKIFRLLTGISATFLWKQVEFLCQTFTGYELKLWTAKICFSHIYGIGKKSNLYTTIIVIHVLG